MIQKTTSSLVPLTRELAEQFFNMRPVPGERPKKPARLKHFQTLLKDGKFGSPVWSQALIGDDRELWRGDGQHTSSVLVACDESLFPKNGTVTIETYHLDSMGEIGDFFELFDNPRSVRSNQDKLSIYIAQHDAVKGIDPMLLGKVLHGIHYYRLDLVRQSGAGQLPQMSLPILRDLGMYLEEKENIEFALWINRWRDTKHAWMVGKPGIVAEVFSDWRDHPEVAAQFWGEVFTESNPDVDEYSRELCRTFLDWNGRQPATGQDRFRSKAHKLWERFRRTAGAPRTPIAA
jgi:hypothetical protein